MLLTCRKFTILILVALLVGACQPYGANQKPNEIGLADSQPHRQNIEMLGHISGSALAISVQGIYAYVGFGYEFAVLDISDPAQPRWISDLPLPANAISVAEHYAYIVGRAGFAVVDISDPTSPILLSQLPTESPPMSLAVAGHYAYFGDVEGFHVVDFSNPQQPILISLGQLKSSHSTVVVADAVAYVATVDGVHLFDISQPAQSVQVGFIATRSSAYGLAVVEQQLYFGVNGQLHIFDVSDPMQPVESGQFEVLNLILGITFADHYLYIVTGQGGLHILDIADPTHIVQIQQFATAGIAVAVTVAKGYLYLLDLDEGLRIFDASRLPTLAQISKFMLLGPVYRLALQGNYAYVRAGWNSNLHVIAIDDPANMHQISRHFSDDFMWDFVLSDHYAFCLNHEGLLVLDTDLSADPRVAGFLNLPETFSINISGIYAYTSDPAGNFLVIDIADPAQPRLVASYPAWGYARGLAVAGKWLYLPYDKGMRILEISPGGELTQAIFYSLSKLPTVIRIVDHYAYIALGMELQIMDLAEPIAPKAIGSYNSAAMINDLVVEDGFAFIATDTAGLRVLDVVNPTQISEVGFYKTADVGLQVVVAEDRIYVADRLSGLLVLQFTPPDSVDFE